MPHGVGHLEDAFFRQQRLDLVPGNDVALLQGLDGEVLARVLVLGQDDLKSKTQNFLLLLTATTMLYKISSNNTKNYQSLNLSRF